MNLSNKGLIRDLLSARELVRFPFIPIVYHFGAKLCQTSAQEMMGNPTVLTNSLLTCQELFGYDAVVSGFDLTLHSDAVDYPIPLTAESLAPNSIKEGLKEIFLIERTRYFAVAVEAIQRLTQMVGKKLGIFGIITGPITLASYFGGNVVLEDPLQGNAKQALETSLEDCIEKSKAYGQFQVDGIILSERCLSSPLIQSIEFYEPVYQALNNVIHFYNSHSIIAVSHFDPKQLESFCRLKPDGILLGEWEEGSSDFSELKKLLDRYHVCFGIGVPFSSGKEKMFSLLEWLIKEMERQKLKRGIFLSSGGEVPYNMEAGDMGDFVNAIMQIHL